MDHHVTHVMQRSGDRRKTQLMAVLGLFCGLFQAGDDGTGRLIAGATGLNEFSERMTHGLQIADACLDVAETSFCQCSGFLAGTVTQFEQVGDLAQRETQLLSALDEAQPREDVGRISAHAAYRFARRGE